jgi:HlyD family secretion protein
LADISSAVVAPGKVEVKNKQQVVEHLDGGVVGQIMVRDGDSVMAGNVLLRFDDTLMRNERESFASQYWELVARTSRLEAEQNQRKEINFSAELLAAAAHPSILAIVQGQKQLFDARLRTLADQVEQLRERQSQIYEQLTGAKAQTRALERQLSLVAQELVGQQKLYDSGLAQLNRLLSLQREQARLEGEVGGLLASMAESRGRVAEIEIQILNLESSRQEQAITQLRDIQYQQNQVREQLASVEERLDRLDVRAPIDGVVLGMTVFSERSVVSAGEPILYIVPSNSVLVIESQIDTVFIDQVWAGQPASLRFSAFSSRTTPELEGHVVKVSPDAFTDERTGRTYYTATLAPNEGEMAKLEGLTLVPGMPVEGYITAGDRTPLSYLTKPLTDYFSGAMLEE